MAKLKLALIGCGAMAQKHVRAIAAHKKDIEIVSICDRQASNLRAMEKTIGLKGYLSYEKLLKETSANVVLLTTPNGFHCSQTLLAAKHKKHVITEKPMALTVHDAKQMIKACKKNRVKLFVDFQMRKNPPLVKLKQTVKSKKLGKIYMVLVNILWNRSHKYYKNAPWRGTRKWDGGSFLNQGSHYLDLLTWMFGPLASVKAHMDTLARPIQTEDAGTVSLRWRSGTLGSINITVLAHKKNYESSLTVLGEKGIERVDLAAKSRHPQGHELVLFYRDVIQVLRGKKIDYCSGEEGIKALQTIEACQRSSHRS